MNDFWNERYSSEEFAYGTEPNQFYKEQLEKMMPGKILFPAEGEGRNAVYAAKKGWSVTAFDPSNEGRKKAQLLAKKNKVQIDYHIENYDSVDFEKESFDCLVLVFAHMNPLKRKEYHQKLTGFLKPGGALILEGFSKKQIQNNTGGPQNVDMLFSIEELENDFQSFSKLKITEAETELQEGQFHRGKSSVIRIFGIK